MKKTVFISPMIANRANIGQIVASLIERRAVRSVTIRRDVIDGGVLVEAETFNGEEK